MRIEWLNQEALQHGAVTLGAALASVPVALADGVSRRGFMKAGAVAGGGLMLGFFLPGAGKLAQAADAAPAKPVYAPNAFLHIAPDNTVTVQVNRLEFGQGVQTSLPMLIAEELDADWRLVHGALAPAGEQYKDAAYGMQMTGGSGSIAHSFTQYREIGAKARAMLVGAAAAQWKVSPDQVRAAKGVLYGPGGQKATYGELADAAMRQPVPATVKLKDPRDFAIIGKPVKRLDAAAKSTGKQQFGIDFKPPGAKVAMVARPPVFGARVAKFDASKAKAIKGVLEVLEVKTDRGGSGVAVIADGYWPAKQGRDALVIEWDSSAVEKVSSVKQLAAFKALAKTPGTVARAFDVAALSKAPKKIEAVYEFPYLAHAPMEPLSVSYGAKPKDALHWREKMLRETGIASERVHFLGKIPYPAYRSLLQVSAAHVYLTYPFVLSWSMLEAMACGCLLIASDTAPVREVIQHGDNGMLVDFFDVDALSATVLAALDAPEAGLSMRLRAVQTVRNNYSLQKGNSDYRALMGLITMASAVATSIS